MMKEQKKILFQAKEEFNNQNFDKAKILFEEVISINPKNFEALHAIGLILTIQKEFNGAINFFQKSLLREILVSKIISLFAFTLVFFLPFPAFSNEP